MSKVILELRDDNCLYDANGTLIVSALSMNYKYFSAKEDQADKTIELVKLGLTVDDIIKLKNMELL